MFPYPFMELMATLIVGVFVYWPPFILMHVRPKCIDWYEKSRMRVSCCPSMLAVWVSIFVFHTIAFAAWILHTFVIPFDGMLISAYMLSGIILYFVHLGLWHGWFSALFVHMKTRCAFIWSVLAMLATIATAVMFLFDGELISTILMFIVAAFAIALMAVTLKLWWCDPCAPEGAIRRRRCCAEKTSCVEVHGVTDAHHHHQQPRFMFAGKQVEFAKLHHAQQQQQLAGAEEATLTPTPYTYDPTEFEGDQ
jgi:signal transduction histidine kinase